MTQASEQSFEAWWNARPKLNLDGTWSENYAEVRAEARAAWDARSAEVEELRDQVAHLEFDVDCATLDAEKAECERSPEYLAWVASLPPDVAIHAGTFALRDLHLRKRIESLTAENEVMREEMEDWRNSAAFAAEGGHGDEEHCECVRLLRTALADWKQTSGDLCDRCGWRGKRGGPCAFCELTEAKKRIDLLETETCCHRYMNGKTKFCEVHGDAE